MTNPLTPGVYVREAPGGARAIEAAPTAVAILVGETERGPIGPTSITSAAQFQRLFGGYFRHDASGSARLFMPYAVQGFFDNGGARAYVLRLVADDGGNPGTAAQLLVDAERAITVRDGGGTQARIVQRRAAADGEQLQIVIENATSGIAREFNLRVLVSSDEGATFAPRAATPLLENLSITSGTPDFIATRLANDPDIRWTGPAIRPVNLASGPLVPAGGGPTISSIRARGPGAWGNSVSVAISNSTDGDPARFDLTVFYRPVGEANAREVERFEGLSADPTDARYLIGQLARSVFIEWGNVEPPVAFRPRTHVPVVGPLSGEALAGGAGGIATMASDDYHRPLARLDEVADAALIICASDGMLNAATETDHDRLINRLLGYVEARPQRDLFLVADAPRSTAAADPVGNAVDHARTEITASDHCALYWPWIVVSDPAGQGRNPTRAIPAAGHIAGVHGRIDGQRGVWKVAAGVEASITGAIELDHEILARDHDRMHPYGLNALRTIPGAGRVVWGGRTGRPTTEWRYINVRRTAMFLRKSIYNGIRWAVFEGNDGRLWAALRASIVAFMDAQFRIGAFVGATSREAYFVKCDADTTTPADQAAGIVNVSVGFAPLRPAEFVVVTLSQMTSR